MMMMIEVPKSWQNAHHLVKDVLMPIVQNNLYYTCNVYTRRPKMLRDDESLLTPVYKSMKINIGNTFKLFRKSSDT